MCPMDFVAPLVFLQALGQRALIYRIAPAAHSHTFNWKKHGQKFIFIFKSASTVSDCITISYGV